MAIKKDAKGMVVVVGAKCQEVKDLADMQDTWEKCNASRHVGSTKMNAESSRSHLLFSILIHTKNKMTGKVSTGKLSLVDLAGSERASKTGATADRLKEAQSI